MNVILKNVYQECCKSLIGKQLTVAGLSWYGPHIIVELHLRLLAKRLYRLHHTRTHYNEASFS